MTLVIILPVISSRPKITATAVAETATESIEFNNFVCCTAERCKSALFITYVMVIMTRLDASLCDLL